MLNEEAFFLSTTSISQNEEVSLSLSISEINRYEIRHDFHPLGRCIF